MLEVNNKFEIGEEVYTGIRVPVKYKCPICDGEGKFLHNGYEVRCNNCCGSGKLHNTHQFLLEPVKVRIQRIIASIWNEQISIKYKVDCTEANVRNRSETTLFKTFKRQSSIAKNAIQKRWWGNFNKD